MALCPCCVLLAASLLLTAPVRAKESGDKGGYPLPIVTDIAEEGSKWYFPPQIEDPLGILNDDQKTAYRGVVSRWPAARELLIEFMSRGPYSLRSLYSIAFSKLRRRKLYVAMLVDPASQRTAIVTSSRTDPQCVQEYVMRIIGAEDGREGDIDDFYDRLLGVVEDLPRFTAELDCQYTEQEYSGTKFLGGSPTKWFFFIGAILTGIFWCVDGSGAELRLAEQKIGELNKALKGRVEFKVREDKSGKIMVDAKRTDWSRPDMGPEKARPRGKFDGDALPKLNDQLPRRRAALRRSTRAGADKPARDGKRHSAAKGK